MRARVKTQVIIHTDAATAFKYLSHTKYHHLWNPNLQSVKPITQLKNNDMYHTKSLVLGVRVKAGNTVTKFVQDEMIEIENKTGMLQYCVNYHLVSSNEGIKLICNTLVSAEGKAFAFARPLLQQLAIRELNSDLKAFKEAVEEGRE